MGENAKSLSGTEPRAASHSVAVALLAHLRRARDHIDRNFSEPLDLDRLAQVAGVSKYHFARSFEAAYGETPIRYVTRRRIERAQDLLGVANLTVTGRCSGHRLGFRAVARRQYLSNTGCYPPGGD